MTTLRTILVSVPEPDDDSGTVRAIATIVFVADMRG